MSTNDTGRRAPSPLPEQLPPPDARSPMPAPRKPGLLSYWLRRRRTEITRGFAQGRVLELGCGPGVLYRTCRERMSSYIGVDAREAHIIGLREEFPEARFIHADLDEDSLPDDIEVDVVLMVALIEHLFNQKHVMKQVRRCLAPGGHVVLTSPTPFGNDVVHRMGGALGLFSRGAVDDHVVIYNRKRLETLAREVGLEVETHRTFQLGTNQLAVLRRNAR